MKKTSQISVEYILVFSLILMIVIPGIFFFRNYATVIGDRITKQRITKIANYMIDNAREQYYFGAPSKIVIDVELPEGIENIGVLQSNGGEYVLIFSVLTSTGTATYFFDSDVPIVMHDELNDALNSNCYDLASNCQNAGYDCVCLPHEENREGRHYFNIEAEDDSSICNPATLCVMIDEVSEDLS